MKKIGYWLATVALAVICVCALVACGGVEGTYKFYSMKVESMGIEMEIKAGEEMEGITISEDFMTLELKSDGKVVLSSKMGGAVTVEGEWKLNDEDNSKVDITIKGDTQTVTLDGSKLIMEVDGSSVTFKK